MGSMERWVDGNWEWYRWTKPFQALTVLILEVLESRDLFAFLVSSSAASGNGLDWAGYLCDTVTDSMIAGGVAQR